MAQHILASDDKPTNTRWHILRHIPHRQKETRRGILIAAGGRDMLAAALATIRVRLSAHMCGIPPHALFGAGICSIWRCGFFTSLGQRDHGPKLAAFSAASPEALLPADAEDNSSLPLASRGRICGSRRDRPTVISSVAGKASLNHSILFSDCSLVALHSLTCQNIEAKRKADPHLSQTPLQILTALKT